MPKILLIFPLLPFFGFAGLKDSTDRWKFKIGVKLNVERTAVKALTPEFHAFYNPALQFMVQIKNSSWSFQTGINKTRVYDAYYKRVAYNFLNVPMNMRFDKFGFYISGGVFLNYILKQSESSGEWFNKNLGFGINHTVGYEINIKAHFTILWKSVSLNNSC